MPNKLSALINPEELISMRSASDLVLVDVRTGADAGQRYLSAHLAGARRADLEHDLAAVTDDAADGGRHPLPSPAQFARTLAKLGLTPKSHVVVYDDKQGANAAARLWWMLRAIGHAKVQLLNGGFQAAVEAGFPLSEQAESEVKAGDYRCENWVLPTADIDAVAAAVKDENSLVVDVREAKRYAGETEPIDLIAGHIPGAINIPFAGNLDAQGFFLAPEKLREKYLTVFGNLQSENIIVHCGSGVTACHTLLALDYAGFAMPKLYVGSWSEWSNNDLPIATVKK